MLYHHEDGAVFRPMTLEDVPAVAEMEKICFRSPWSKRMLGEELKNPIAHYHVLELDAKIISYAGMWVVYDEAHITNVAVLPPYRRQGYARRVMLLSMRAAILQNAAQMTLEVRESNVGAQTFYFGLGFELAGKRRGYYGDTKEDALILWNRNINKTVQELCL
ncbi:MAG: ribosomal protein S18-alanine N-acetyltransferase [Clostridiales bacterium]|jgi:ribosomal-protein-alanine N-acetyltransferase|nr:ribosomal protein S18-alanine N-acetyltransferase [Clostridiales bacterium]